MSTVRIRAANDEVFEVGSEWLPMLHKSEHLQLPIKSKKVMDCHTLKFLNFKM